MEYDRPLLRLGVYLVELTVDGPDSYNLVLQPSTRRLEEVFRLHSSLGTRSFEDPRKDEMVGSLVRNFLVCQTRG